MSFGGILRELLDERAWSHQELADRSGIPRPTITALANNKRKPRPEHFFALAKALNIPVSELFVAAGYIREARMSYDKEETPQQIIDRIRLDTRKLEKLLGEDHADNSKNTSR